MKNKNITVLGVLFLLYQVFGLIALYDVFFSTHVKTEYIIAKGIIVFACIISSTIMLKYSLKDRDEKKIKEQQVKIE